MKQLLEAINRGILRCLRENNIELLTDLDDENLDQIDSIQTKSVNNKIDGYAQLIKPLLINAVRTGKIHDKLKQIINDPNNFRKFKGVIKANGKGHLRELIWIGQKLFGKDGNFNWIDTSEITDMSELFRRTATFNGHIELWDVSNVKNMDQMFEHTIFNGDISEWDVSNVTTMSFMFSDSAFNGDISKWDVSNVITMDRMFSHSKFTGENGDISGWDVSNVKDMSYMFSYTNFNQPIGKWDIHNVRDISGMFGKTNYFNQDISDWDIRNITYMSTLFYCAKSFNKDLSKWDVRNVEEMNYMFYFAESFNQDLSKWKIKKTCKTEEIFKNCNIKEEYKPKMLKN